LRNTAAAAAVDVQRSAPFAKMGHPRLLTLSPGRLSPVIRIAHRVIGRLALDERIIRDHELVLILRGRGRLVFRDESISYDGAARTLLFIPPFAPHRFELGSDVVEHVAVHFDLAPDVPPPQHGLRDRTPYTVRLTGGLAVPRVAYANPANEAEPRLLRIVKAYAGDPILGPVEASAELIVLLARLLRPMPETQDDPVANARIDRAIAFVLADLARAMSVEQLAGVAGLSTSRFNVLFRGRTGVAPMEYVRRARVAEARRLLANVNLSIKQIAHQLGFADPFHFSKVFRAVDGLPPTHFREALLAGRRS
jgi:AraC-like DNA-binding protein